MNRLFKINRLFFYLIGVLILTVMMILPPVQADRLVITAFHNLKAPSSIDDPLWLKIRQYEIPVKGRENLASEPGLVKIRSLYTNDSIYFLFKWDDPTRSVVKQSWQFDGKKWHHLKGNEDRIAILFEITRIDKFATRGCAITCHSPADRPKKDWKLATRTDVEKGDLWHWKAARSNPYNYADDAWLTVAGNPTGSYRETGRRKDKGNGGDVINETADKQRPLYMQNPNQPASVQGFLLFEEALKINSYSGFKANDIIPYRLPVKPSGSRFDVKAIGHHTGGQWTVMLYRKLDTGHDDDVRFNPDKKYSFAIAVFDDSGGDHSKATLPLTLIFRQ